MNTIPMRLPSGNISIPYEWQAKPITGENVKNFRCINIHYCRMFNGQVTDIIRDRWFFNRTHFEGCLKHWNSLGESMARKPNPIDGKTYHWQYREIVT